MSTPIIDEAATLFADPTSYAVNSFFTELLPRLKSIELNGKPELIATTFVGGLKHLPIRYELR
jgi:50S ribosomal subunit-associated GTPase HflX